MEQHQELEKLSSQMVRLEAALEAEKAKLEKGRRNHSQEVKHLLELNLKLADERDKVASDRALERKKLKKQLQKARDEVNSLKETAGENAEYKFKAGQRALKIVELEEELEKALSKADSQKSPSEQAAESKDSTESHDSEIDGAIKQLPDIHVKADSQKNSAKKTDELQNSAEQFTLKIDGSEQQLQEAVEGTEPKEQIFQDIAGDLFAGCGDALEDLKDGVTEGNVPMHVLEESDAAFQAQNTDVEIALLKALADAQNAKDALEKQKATHDQKLQLRDDEIAMLKTEMAMLKSQPAKSKPNEHMVLQVEKKRLQRDLEAAKKGQKQWQTAFANLQKHHNWVLDSFASHLLLCGPQYEDCSKMLSKLNLSPERLEVGKDIERDFWDFLKKLGVADNEGPLDALKKLDLENKARYECERNLDQERRLHLECRGKLAEAETQAVTGAEHSREFNNLRREISEKDKEIEVWKDKHDKLHAKHEKQTANFSKNACWEATVQVQQQLLWWVMNTPFGQFLDEEDQGVLDLVKKIGDFQDLQKAIDKLKTENKDLRDNMNKIAATHVFLTAKYSKDDSWHHVREQGYDIGPNQYLADMISQNIEQIRTEKAFIPKLDELLTEELGKLATAKEEDLENSPSETSFQAIERKMKKLLELVEKKSLNIDEQIEERVKAKVQWEHDRMTKELFRLDNWWPGVIDNSALVEKLKGTGARIDELEKDKTESKLKIDELTKEKRHADGEVSRLMESNITLQKTIHSLNTTGSLNRQLIEHLKDQIKDLEQHQHGGSDPNGPSMQHQQSQFGFRGQQPNPFAFAGMAQRPHAAHSSYASAGTQQQNLFASFGANTHTNNGRQHAFNPTTSDTGSRFFNQPSYADMGGYVPDESSTYRWTDPTSSNAQSAETEQTEILEGLGLLDDDEEYQPPVTIEACNQQQPQSAFSSTSTECGDDEEAADEHPQPELTDAGVLPFRVDLGSFGSQADGASGNRGPFQFGVSGASRTKSQPQDHVGVIGGERGGNSERKKSRFFP